MHDISKNLKKNFKKVRQRATLWRLEQEGWNVRREERGKGEIKRQKTHIERKR